MTTDQKIIKNKVGQLWPIMSWSGIQSTAAVGQATAITVSHHPGKIRTHASHLPA